MKLSAEQLSRILSAHEAGKLCRLGTIMNRGKCCAFQAAENSHHGYFNPIAKWFDVYYSPSWSADRLLRFLETGWKKCEANPTAYNVRW